MNRARQPILLLCLLGISCAAMAAPGALENVERQPLNITAIGMFLVFVAATLVIAWWAASKTRSMNDFYTAGGSITGIQNGVALAGDYMSAAALLGVTSMIFFHGYDGVIYAISFFVAWPLLLFLFAERIRNLGRVTIADIASFRLDQNRIRTLTACGSLTVVCFYLVVQMVGAGQLIELLFGLPYNYAVIVVGVLMAIYVTFGGMVATTWVQIIKAGLLLFGGTLLAVLALSRFDFSIDRLLTQAVAVRGARILLPSELVADPVALISLSVGLVFGTAGLPHILSMYWKGLTTRGALLGGVAGLLSSVILVVLSPALGVKVLGHAHAIYPYDYPAIASMSIAFVFAWLGSVTDRSDRATWERDRFDDQYVRAQTGWGASSTVGH